MPRAHARSSQGAHAYRGINVVNPTPPPLGTSPSTHVPEQCHGRHATVHPTPSVPELAPPSAGPRATHHATPSDAFAVQEARSIRQEESMTRCHPSHRGPRCITSTTAPGADEI
ncbi:hypothetical protein KC19_12G190200 [Ceratodon purpureus]|uniref:Uncharacterized protein n=1 Tax=Ceratodon purpureus TaxID=3225 RepID=A0A8T0GAI4_CERPU|nr:hypothetical protein KC19_12G190200 [Ceratodon purpureus]